MKNTMKFDEKLRRSITIFATLFNYSFSLVWLADMRRERRGISLEYLTEFASRINHGEKNNCPLFFLKSFLGKFLYTIDERGGTANEFSVSFFFRKSPAAKSMASSSWCSAASKQMSVMTHRKINTRKEATGNWWRRLMEKGDGG